jgi:hypothetical protein
MGRPWLHVMPCDHWQEKLKDFLERHSIRILNVQVHGIHTGIEPFVRDVLNAIKAITLVGTGECSTACHRSSNKRTSGYAIASVSKIRLTVPMTGAGGAVTKQYAVLPIPLGGFEASRGNLLLHKRSGISKGKTSGRLKTC